MPMTSDNAAVSECHTKALTTAAELGMRYGDKTPITNKTDVFKEIAHLVTHLCPDYIHFGGSRASYSSTPARICPFGKDTDTVARYREETGEIEFSLANMTECFLRCYDSNLRTRGVLTTYVYFAICHEVKHAQQHQGGSPYSESQADAYAVEAIRAWCAAHRGR